MVSRSRICGARRKALSGLEGLLRIVNLLKTMKSVGAMYTFEQMAGEFQILGAATLKPWAPNEVRTNGTESRLVFDNLRERVE